MQMKDVNTPLTTQDAMVIIGEKQLKLDTIDVKYKTIIGEMAIEEKALRNELANSKKLNDELEAQIQNRDREVEKLKQDNESLRGKIKSWESASKIPASVKEMVGPKKE